MTLMVPVTVYSGVPSYTMTVVITNYYSHSVVYFEETRENTVHYKAYLYGKSFPQPQGPASGHH